MLLELSAPPVRLELLARRVQLAQLEQLVLRDQPVLPDLLVQLEQPALRVLPDLQVLPEQRELLGPLARLVQQVQQALQDPLVQLAP